MHISQQDHSYWLEMRKNKIGASDAPIIMQVSPWKTPYQLWEEKLGLRTEAEMTEWMQRGKDLETKALTLFEETTGLVMLPQMFIQHPDYQWMVATVDGIDISHTNIVEIKCPGKQDHSTALCGMIPSKYIPQLQHQMEVTGVEKAYYFSFDGEDGVVLEIDRDDKYIQSMLEKEIQFLECLQKLKPPSLTDKDYVAREDDLWLALSKQWIECKKKMHELEENEELLRDQLLELSANKNTQGGGIKISRTVRVGSVDYGSIPQLKGIDMEPFRKPPVESWRITVT